ncbi:MAG: ComF family protein [Chitinophagaceae bacterium]|nr:ComF family protein [Chitinophagaceae bacterium]
MSFTSTFFNDTINLLYPVVCPGCGSDSLSAGQVLCFDCINEMPVTDFYLHEQNPVERIFRGRLPLISACAHVYFTKDSAIQNMLHRLKYGGRKEIGIYMGKLIGEDLKTTAPGKSLQGLVPLPLNNKKQKKRGYNQAQVICEGIASKMNIPVLNDVIVRKKNTETQTHKSRAERWNNIEGKFELSNAAKVMNKHVLLVDDVVTTGATLESCGTELLKARGLQLSIAAFAYTTL